MADFKHRRDRGIVRFSGEFNLAAAVDLVETVDLLTRVYFYDLIEIQIPSLGGVSTALEHFLAAHERWRAAGVRVRTRVVDRAASAAALLLSRNLTRRSDPLRCPSSSERRRVPVFSFRPVSLLATLWGCIAPGRRDGKDFGIGHLVGTAACRPGGLVRHLTAGTVFGAIARACARA